MQAPFRPPIAFETPRDELDRILAKTKAAAPRFARLPIRDRLALFDHIADRYHAVLDDMVRAGSLAKGLDPEKGESGEEWFAHGFCIARFLRALHQSLNDLALRGEVRFEKGRLSRRAHGGLAMRLYPIKTLESLTFPGVNAEVNFQQDLTEEDLRERQASFYKRPHSGKVALVLGAGNVASIPSKDALTKMFVDGSVVILKMNPVNQYLGPFLEQAFAPAIDQGFFALVYGGAEVGGYLAQHEDVDEVHVTGSDRTHQAIVWGPPGPERDARMARDEPLLKKEITSELGNVSAVLVVPGPWSESDFTYQGQSVAGMVANNASFNCNAAKLLVQPAGWAGAGRLLKKIEEALAATPTRLAYYPGAGQRYRRFTEGRPFLREIGVPQQGELPWAIVSHLDPSNRDEPLFREEPWCSVLGETQISGDDPVRFLDEAVRFVNERVWGTLNVCLLVHPRTAAEASEALERAIEDLRYGTVGVNIWPAAGFSLGVTPWGGHPSSSLKDIQSGRGWSGNTLMLAGVEKTVVRAPFRMVPKPVWFPGHRTLADLGRRDTLLERAGSWRRLPGVAITALRG